ncbi:type II secretion system protein [Francisella sp. 19X1-34]|uniref:PulJ/GspJ family protein n=1 Tax=Francisella sp. 19X1-34 TaxID=3087177 RepID=UPI002E36C6D3|nr:type II secretion system protein [Francisella sp. 19X1-34]MED7788496.1 type II secretion system protein [Francisella sp. 19X1-34]
MVDDLMLEFARKKGFSLLEIIIVLAVLSFLLLIFYRILVNVNINKQNQALSQQILRYVSLVEKEVYSQKNFQNIRAINFKNKLNCKVTHNGLDKIQCMINIKSKLLKKGSMLTLFNQKESNLPNQNQSIVVAQLKFDIDNDKTKEGDLDASLVMKHLNRQNFVNINFKTKKSISLKDKHIVIIELVGKTNAGNWLDVSGKNSMQQSLEFLSNDQPHYIKNVAKLLYGNQSISYVKGQGETDILSSSLNLDSKTRTSISSKNLNVNANNIKFNGLNQKSEVEIANNPGEHGNELTMYDLNIKEKGTSKKFSQSKVVKRKIVILGTKEYDNVSPDNQISPVQRYNEKCDKNTGGKFKLIVNVLSSKIYTSKYIIKRKKHVSKTVYTPKITNSDNNIPKTESGVLVTYTYGTILIKAINGIYNIQTISVCDYSKS